ncbi:paREP13 [Pyrobaculum aerophilum str. IM2]|uniref:PaREP13 n=1 Tax=Pyrobaculum aerophilum (strain ATCC 51768 / DSM 7523 / JCM 9630 / CIP 104966 / NBRC 100827 / IM2) TaxID=178306 RepID=Q8ZUT7_PYRAE|nr:paREP13 [Pyrobaculum aerophilum str. IM2]
MESPYAPHPAPGRAGRPWRAGRRRGEPAEGVSDTPGVARPGSLWRSGAPCPPGTPGEQKGGMCLDNCPTYVRT